MKYVLDASVALKWVLAEPDSAKAIRLRDEFRKSALELVAPDFFPLEIAHALTKAERQGKIAVPQGGTCWRDVMSTSPQLFPSLPLVPRAYAIATAARIGIYDCLYVALAARENCELVTADDRLVKDLGATYPFIIALASLP